jgi:hypothetical protein
MLKRARNANANAASKRLRAASHKRTRNSNANVAANAASKRPKAASQVRARRPPATWASRQRAARDSAIARRRLQREYAQDRLAMTRRALGRARSLRDQLDLVRRVRQLEMELHAMGARR